MTPRCLLGPVGDEFIAEYLGPLRAAGRCRAFGPGPAADLRVHPRDSWDDALARLPADWRADIVGTYRPA